MFFYKGGLDIKRETCPFCGHRWIRSSKAKIIKCPNCKAEYEYDQQE